MLATVESTPLLLHDENGRIRFNNRLLHCIERGYHQEVLAILKKSADPGHARDWKGKTLLHYAAEQGKLTVLQYLIEFGADVDAQDSQGKPPLMSILSYPYNIAPVKMIEILFKANANIHICDHTGTSVLKRFLETEYHGIFLKKLSDDYSGDVEKIAKKLIDLNCSIYHVLELKNAAVTRILLDNRCPLEPANYSYGPGDVFVKSISNKDFQNTKLLLDHGIDVNAENIYGNTILLAYGNIYAYKDGNLALLRLLLDRGVHPMKIISKGPSKGRMQMINILNYGKVATVRMLLECNVDLEAKDEWGCTALHYLAENPSANIFEALKGKKLDVNARDTDRSSPLHFSEGTNLSTVKFLVCCGANINAEDNSGMTPLIRIWKNFTNLYQCRDLGPLSLGTPLEKSDQVINYLLYHGTDVQVDHSIFSNIRFEWQLYWMQSILAQLSINKARGMLIEKFIENKIAEHDKLREYFSMCSQQLDQMKQVKIWKSISLYDILIASERKFQRCVRNERLLLNICRLKYQNKYLPYYYYVVRRRVVKATKIARRRKEIAAILCRIIGLQRDHIVANQITEYLDDLDLRKMYCT